MEFEGESKHYIIHDVEKVTMEREPRKISRLSIESELKNVLKTGILGSGERETDPSQTSFLTNIWKTLPWILLTIQFLWSTTVVVGIFLLQRGHANVSSLSRTFWQTKASVSSSVVSGVGWALFILLAFFIREASARYYDANICQSQISNFLVQILRQVLQAYPPGTWHFGDLDRITAHLIAYPIALKMTLRHEREAEQLNRILHPADISDVLNARELHIYCSKVVRSYIHSNEKYLDCRLRNEKIFQSPGKATRHFIIDLLDELDKTANRAVQIERFHPSRGYTNHMRIFMFIWFFFLPLAIVRSSGWFTIGLSMLISYGVGMLFYIASALNEPYGFDLQDLKLNRISASTALTVLKAYDSLRSGGISSCKKGSLTPRWLEKPLSETDSKRILVPSTPWAGSYSFLKKRSFHPNARLPLLIYTIWISFVVFGTWGLSKANFLPPDPGQKCRWWCIYIPLDASTTKYIGLGLFLVVGFWINDAYSRYSNGINQWNTIFRTNLFDAASRITLVCRADTWHTRDRQRIFSHLAALPFIAKHILRGSSGMVELLEFLSKEDYETILRSEDPFSKCLDVLYGYLNVLGYNLKENSSVKINPSRASSRSIYYNLRNIESAVSSCVATRRYPVSYSFTSHMTLFTIFWLALLPLTVVQHDGFITFLHALPIGYSIINIFITGSELSDPFGTDDSDIPLDDFCNEFKSSLHSIFRRSRLGPASFVRNSFYKTKSFSPSKGKNEALPSDENETPSQTDPDLEMNNGVRDPQHPPTPSRSMKTVLDKLPKVPLSLMIAVFMWIVIAVFSSYGLSLVWGVEKRNQCRRWCSPIDVSGNVLVNTGFALFMILAFRAGDSIRRYQDGAKLLFDFQKNLRSLALEVVSSFTPNTWHEHDIHRIVAHLIQIPLSFRDILLQPNNFRYREREGILSFEDFESMQLSDNPVVYLTEVIEAYIMTIDSTDPDRQVKANREIDPSVTVHLLKRLSSIRQDLWVAIGVKRFPMATSYTNHQQLFTALWLVLLPFGMAPSAGFLTILWAPLVSYAVLSLDIICSQLVDPFGKDQTDVRVDQLCTHAATSVLDAVRSVGWGCKYHTLPTDPSQQTSLGYELHGRTISNQYTLPHFEEFESTPSNFGEGSIVKFNGPSFPMITPTFYAHLQRSVPWWVIPSFAVWTALAASLTFITRVEGQKVRWWTSYISSDPETATYISFIAFLLLGFFLDFAIERFNIAGEIWGDNLRSACHGLAVQFYSLVPDGSLHDGDLTRALAHVASIPIVLKTELRNSRDIRGLAGLLSQSDIARIHSSDSMTAHCVDVLRSYIFSYVCHPEHLKTGKNPTGKLSILSDLQEVEKSMKAAFFIKTVKIAPDFLKLLNFILVLLFFKLPFTVSESSGWFSIIIVPLIAYGVIGMYSVSDELQNPFGTDLNDLDLDLMADEIVREVLFVQKHYKSGTKTLVMPNPEHTSWSRGKTIQSEENMRIDKEKMEPESPLVNVRNTTVIEGIWMAYSIVPLGILLLVLLWAIVSTTSAWLISESFPFKGASCKPWFCSAIAVKPEIEEYIGFAVFLMLGFRVLNSHCRYVKGLNLWLGGIIGHTRLVSNRLFENYSANTWHEGDLGRIAGHLAAYPLLITTKLRRESPKVEKLKNILGPEDIKRIQATADKCDYCVDVIRGYILDIGNICATNDNVLSVSSVTHKFLLHDFSQLRKSASDCIQLKKFPLPYGCVQHLRIFAFIWLVFLPLTIVESSGWLTILWTIIIAYGVLGIEGWANDLTDPFGYDTSDLPLDQLCDETEKIIQENLKIFQSGNKSLVNEDRHYCYD